jgi:hypothetical protein
MRADAHALGSILRQGSADSAPMGANSPKLALNAVCKACKAGSIGTGDVHNSKQGGNRA